MTQNNVAEGAIDTGLSGVTIRPIWAIDRALKISEKEPNDLLQLESLIRETLKSYLSIVRAFELSTESNISTVELLVRAASVDLVAACEMARSGYMKQAYTLWRSWYEQVIFALYFLEAPLHREAWKFSETVSQADSPNYRLMLHQLLNDSGERHAFALVYADRYAKLIQIFKASNPPREQAPIKRAARILTQLSQGVHGTFRPKSMESLADVCLQLKKHGTPTLRNAWDVVSELWLLFIVNVIALPENEMNQMRNGSLTEDQIAKHFEFASKELYLLNLPFKTAFQSLKNG